MCWIQVDIDRYNGKIEQAVELIIKLKTFSGMITDEEIRTKKILVCDVLSNDVIGLTINETLIYLDAETVSIYTTNDLVDLITHELYHTYQMSSKGFGGFNQFALRYLLGMLMSLGSTGTGNSVELDAYHFEWRHSLSNML